MADENDLPEGDEPEGAAAETPEGEDAEDQNENPDSTDDGDQDEGDAQDTEGEGVEEPQRRLTPQERIRKIAAERKEERTRAENAERLAREAVERAERAERAAQDNRRQKEEEDERVALANMTEAERVTYGLAKQVKNIQEGQRALAVQTADATDRAEFTGFLSGRPEFKKYEAEVTNIFADQMKKGQPIARKAILANLIGQSILNGGAKVKEQQGRAAQRRAGQRQGSGAVRSNASGGSSKSGSVVDRMERDDPRI